MMEVCWQHGGYLNTNANVSFFFFFFLKFQELAVSMRTGVCRVPVLTEERAARCPAEATRVRVSLVTPVLAALTTQTSVLPRRLFAKTKASVSTLRAPISKVSIKASEPCDFYPLTRLMKLKYLPPKVRVYPGVHRQTLRELLHPLLAFAMPKWRYLPPEL